MRWQFFLAWLSMPQEIYPGSEAPLELNFLLIIHKLCKLYPWKSSKIFQFLFIEAPYLQTIQTFKSDSMPIIRDIIKKRSIKSSLLHDLSFAGRCKCRCWKRRSVICCGKWTSWARRVNGTRAGCIGTVASRSRNSVAPSEIWGTRVHRRGTWERCAARWHGTSVFRTSRYAADFRFTPVYQPRRSPLFCYNKAEKP